MEKNVRIFHTILYSFYGEKELLTECSDVWSSSPQSAVQALYTKVGHTYQSLSCETAINTEFSELFSLKCIYVKYKNAILSHGSSF